MMPTKAFLDEGQKPLVKNWVEQTFNFYAKEVLQRIESLETRLQVLESTKQEVTSTSTTSVAADPVGDYLKSKQCVHKIQDGSTLLLDYKPRQITRVRAVLREMLGVEDSELTLDNIVKLSVTDLLTSHNVSDSALRHILEWAAIEGKSFALVDTRSEKWSVPDRMRHPKTPTDTEFLEDIHNLIAEFYKSNFSNASQEVDILGGAHGKMLARIFIKKERS